MDFTLKISFFTVGLFLVMLLFLEVGRRIGIRRTALDPEGARTGVGAIEGAVFALLGLLIAFTFSGAAARLDTRRNLIVEEANAIGTAYLRLDLLAGQAGTQLRNDFRRYLETRLQYYRKYQDLEAAQQEWDKAMAMQAEIWNRAIAACRDAGSQSATMLLLPAINQMIDITSTRLMATIMHPPNVIFAMLTVMALISALVAGYGMTSKKHSWLHMIGFAAVIAVTVYVILDLEYPRRGMISIQEADKVLSDLLRSMR